jgi:hypothetical protein
MWRTTLSGYHGGLSAANVWTVTTLCAIHTLFHTPRRREQDVSSDRNDGSVWIDAFDPSWCLSWLTPGPAMQNLLDLRATSYHPSSMAQGRRGSADGGSVPNSRLSSLKPSLQRESLHLPTPDTQNRPVKGPDITLNSYSRPAKREHPNLQLHVHTSRESNARLTLATSSLTNHPSPMFITPPIKISATGLVFDGHLAVGYQSGAGLVHLYILDGLNSYVPSAPHRNQDPGAPRDNRISIFQS